MKNLDLNLLSRSLFLFLCLSSLITFGGCATLPRFEEVAQRLDVEKEKTPEVIGPHGTLSPKISKAVMERLKRQEGPTDILERQIALVESISGAPLVAGNKVTLLIDGP